MTLSNRQARRKIKEVLDKLGHITRAQMINFSKAAAKEVLSTPQSELACAQELCNMHKLKADAAQRQIRSL